MIKLLKHRYLIVKSLPLRADACQNLSTSAMFHLDKVKVFWR